MITKSTRPSNIGIYLPYEMREQQSICRDCYAGATVIKSRNLTTLLGRPNASYYLPAITSEGDDPRWRQQYLAEAWFPPMFEEFIDDCIGLMNFNKYLPDQKKKLTLDVAKEELKWLSEYTDEDYGGLDALKVRINTEQWLVGQYLLALDVFVDTQGQQQFKCVEYTSESIILTACINDPKKIDRVVCREEVIEFDKTTKQNNIVNHYRIFGLDRSGLNDWLYWTVEMDETTYQSYDIVVAPGKIVPQYKGKTLNRLPLICVNTNSLGFNKFTKVPAYSLADCVVQIYRYEGRLVFGHRFAANPTPIFSNVRMPGDKPRERKGADYFKPGLDISDTNITESGVDVHHITLGSSKAIVVNSDNAQLPATVSYLEPRCDGFASIQTLIDALIEYASGWDIRKLLSTTGTNASAEAVSMRGQVGIADIQIVDKMSADGISELLRLAAIWTGVSEEVAREKIVFEHNSDYVRTEYTNSNAPKDAQIRQVQPQQPLIATAR